MSIQNVTTKRAFKAYIIRVASLKLFRLSATQNGDRFPFITERKLSDGVTDFNMCLRLLEFVPWKLLENWMCIVYCE